mgnify:CR=1 FL=1
MIRLARDLWVANRYTILITALAMSILFAVGVGLYFRGQPEPWAPLSYQSAPQTVLGPREAVSVGGARSTLVVLRWDGHRPPTFETTGSKCNNWPKTIVKHTVRNYRTVSPVGSVVDDGDSIVDMLPGCVTRTEADPYVNVVPQMVLDRAQVLSARSGERLTLWQFRGVETPIDGNGNPGVPRLLADGHVRGRGSLMAATTKAAK